MATTQFDADQVRDGTITNADIADDAAIAQSKINGLSEALSNILPSQSGNANKFLKTNGTVASWDSPSGGGETCNVEALTADKTLTATDAPIQIYTCTENRTVNLPTTGLAVGQKFEIWNQSAYYSLYYINILQSATIIDILFAQKSSVIRWNGGNWILDQGKENTHAGLRSIARNQGSAFGYIANGMDSGAAIGSQSNGSSSGAAIGKSANGSNTGAAIGYYATTNANGSNTVALGAYSKAERNREIVSTATESTTNKAQFTIQKYVEKNLATASAAWQELFIDGTSARLTIIASSGYNFKAQINAIDVTTKDIKAWEITGCIKRDASNNTSLVGTPTVTVIGADTAAASWDARITADNTNESLKVEVKHDSTNNVRFSLNIIATETRV